jgi:glycosyltransferase involved in cell wall biosynthesis
MDPLVSIIIPARNDAKALRLTLDYLEYLRDIDAAEIIVAAAGDTKGLKMLWLGAQLFYGLRVPRARRL